MEFGFSLPTSGPLSAPENLGALVRRGEELGFGFASASDHIVIPKDIASRYPYSETGEFGGSGECLEQLTLLSFVAGQTRTLRLMTSVMVLPHRSPVHTAKILASIDVLSGGRLILGCGVGWMKEEFEILGAPPYEERGAVGDEYILAFKELWTSDNPSFNGKYVRFSDISFTPKPVQKPHPPIWVGGESPHALRRAATLADGWYPLGGNPRFPVATAEQFSEAVARLGRYAEEAGRDPSEIDLAYSGGWDDGPGTRDRPEDERRLFTGSPEQVAGDIHTFAEIGVSHMRVGFSGGSLSETLESMDRFASDVAPLVRD
jgi:probable F420-dependent oxidoreductase